MKKYIHWLSLAFSLCLPLLYPTYVQATELMKATLVQKDPFNQNRIFKNDPLLDLLKRKMKQKGYLLATQDIHPPQDTHLILIIDSESPLGLDTNAQKDQADLPIFLWKRTATAVKEQNIPQIYPHKYTRIFSHDSRDKEKKDHIILQPFPSAVSPSKTDQKTSNQKSKIFLLAQPIPSSNMPHYSQRLKETIRLLQHHKHDICLIDSTQHSKGKKTPTALTEQTFLTHVQDRIHEQNTCFSQSQFTIVDESLHEPQEIKKQIADIIEAGSLPVYFGHLNLDSELDHGCYIDRNKFKSTQDLYYFLAHMSSYTYQKYRTLASKCQIKIKQQDDYNQTISDRLVYEMIDRPLMDQTVEISIHSGLGNQMFQYAAAFAYAQKHGKQLYRDTRSHHLDQIFNVSAPLSSTSSHLYSKQPHSIRKLLSYRNKGGISFFQPNLYRRNDILHLSGYLQGEQFFREFSQAIRKEFTFKNPPSISNQKIIDQMHHENSVSLHIRRRDYVHLGYPLLTQRYYDKAIAYIKKHDSEPMHLYIFSDDIATAKKIFTTKEKHTFVHNKTDYEDLRLMSHCRHNINANSSFSWWGAWLNPNPNKIVIVPDKWDYWHPYWATAIKPPEWISLPAYDTKQKNIAIVYTHTNKTNTWDEIHNSLEKYFLPNHKKNYFLFTDNDSLSSNQDTFVFSLPKEQNNQIIFKNNLLKKIQNRLEKFHVIYFMDNTQPFNKALNEEIMPNKGDQFVFISSQLSSEKPNPQKDTEQEPHKNLPKEGEEIKISPDFISATSDNFIHLINHIDFAIQKGQPHYNDLKQTISNQLNVFFQNRKQREQGDIVLPENFWDIPSETRDATKN